MNVFRLDKEEIEDINARSLREGLSSSKNTPLGEELEDVAGNSIAIENTTILGYIGRLFPESVFNQDNATKMLSFLLYVSFLGLFYIMSQHYVSTNVRKADQLNKEVQELSWNYKTLKADFMLKSTLSNVAKETNKYGFKEAIRAPRLLEIRKQE